MVDGRCNGGDAMWPLKTVLETVYVPGSASALVRAMEEVAHETNKCEITKSLPRTIAIYVLSKATSTVLRANVLTKSGQISGPVLG